jgi:twitching motility protein PilT
MKDATVGDLAQNDLFKGLDVRQLRVLADNVTMVECEDGETIMEQGGKPDCFYLVASGEVVVYARHETRNELVELARVKSYHTIGELGILLDQPRSATVIAGNGVILLRFDKDFFAKMSNSIPGFGLVICRVLAHRLKQTSRNVFLLGVEKETSRPEPLAAGLLPMEFIQRHRVLPLKTQGNTIELGCVDSPTPQLISRLHELLPGMRFRPTIISVEFFDSALLLLAQTQPKTDQAAGEQAPAAPVGPDFLDQSLKQMIAEGASDVLLSSGQKPSWRIDGDIYEIANSPLLSSSDILRLMETVTPPPNMDQFRAENDTDFAYEIPGVARFRVNLFRDHMGVAAVFRLIPNSILTIEQLGLPALVRQLCDCPKGLILVTGPTGSGKSTTLAAMINYLNTTRQAHIITLEDPIEFVHASRKCLVNQREIGPHTSSFARALRAALREAPDIVMVGEMRDLETVMLALETANTGHLVFGTLHTNTAISTVTRIVDMFPGEQQNQVRAVLADTLKAVIAQTLCRRIGGGRIAALEILISDFGVASLIRDGKSHQLLSAMQTGKAKGNRMLNEELARLVKEKIISVQEAFSAAVDKEDLAQKLGVRPEAV